METISDVSMRALGEPLFRVLFESSPSLLLILDPDLTIVAVTDSYLRATMTVREDILGCHLFKVFPDNPKQVGAMGVRNLKSSLMRVVKSLQPDTMAIQRYDIRKDDLKEEFEVRYWSPVNIPVLSDDKSLLYIIHRVEDVTQFVIRKDTEAEREQEAFALQDRARELEIELVQRQQEIRVANQRLNEGVQLQDQLLTLMDAMPDGVVVTDSNGFVQLVNRQFELMFGYDRSEISRFPLRELMPEIEMSTPTSDANENLESHLAVWASESWRWVRRKDGSEFPANIATSRTGSEAGDSRIYSFRDKTSLYNAREAAKHSEQRYQALLDNMLEAVQILSPDFRYLYINEAAARNGRYPRSEMLGKTVMELFPGFEQTSMYRSLKECMDERLTRVEDFDFSYPDGENAWFEFSIQPVPEGLFILALEISDRKRNETDILNRNASLDLMVKERTIELEEAVAELESFSYSVSHDLRAPLRHVLGYIGLLRKALKGQLSESTERYLRVIEASSVEMGQLIDDLLSFSRMARTEFQARQVPLDRIVDDVIRSVESEIKGRDIVWKRSPLPTVTGDPAMLRVAFANIIGNAVKYTRKREHAVIEIGVMPTDLTQTIITIKDNGAGFDMQYVDKLFGVFQRLHRSDEFEGTGIGLAIVRRIIRRHHGDVWAEGEVEKGVTLYLQLPHNNKV